MPRDSSGRCGIPKEVLEALLIEADFYVLPLLDTEIQELLKFDQKGMRYFISCFWLNSGSCNGGVHFKEYKSYEAAMKIYDAYKEINTKKVSYVDKVSYNSDDELDEDEQNIVVREKTIPTNGKLLIHLILFITICIIFYIGIIHNQVFQDGCWKGKLSFRLYVIMEVNCVLKCVFKLFIHLLNADFGFVYKITHVT